MKQSVGRFIVVSLLVLPFANCGEDESFNSDVKFDGYPNVPIVFENDIEIGGGDDTRTIEGPWYLGGFTIINNNTEYSLVVPSIQMTYQSYKNGILQEEEDVIDAGSICDQDDPPRILYATVEPRSTFYGDLDCDAVNDGITDRELIYFEGLPENDSTSYLVTITLDGFMFDADSTTDPIKGRVKKIITLTTQ